MGLRARRRARRLSLTSLIDVIFLLLLFFMLTSTFSRFAEVELSAGGAAEAAAEPGERQVLFVRMTGDGLTLNGEETEPAALREGIAALRGEGPAALLVSAGPEATAQGLADVLVAVRGIEGLPVTVLEGS